MEQINMSILYKAIMENKGSDVSSFLTQHSNVLNEEFGTRIRETPLHVAAKFGHIEIVLQLVASVQPKYLEIRDNNGYTPLMIAATHSGAIPIASCLIEKNENTLTIPVGDFHQTIPVTMALRFGLNEMGHFLYSKTPLEVFKQDGGRVGLVFVNTCLIAEELGIVLHLLHRWEELLFIEAEGLSTIELIASWLPNSLHKLSFWKRCFSHCIEKPSVSAEHFHTDIQQEGANSIAHQGLLYRLIFGMYDLLGMKEIQKIKLQHARVKRILDLLCENVISIDQEKKRIVGEALVAAVTSEKENDEFVVRIIKANLELTSLPIFGYHNQNMQHNLFAHAIRCRKAKIFNLLCGFRFKHVMTVGSMEDNVTLLHVAASLAPSSYLNHISGAALQMQREMQWFKVVESVMDPGLRRIQGNDGLNPLDLFKKNHRELRNQGESWMKSTASSYSVVAALVIASMFAAILAFPGGYNELGYPSFIKEAPFKVFLLSNGLSLLFSTTSVFTFLGILTSRYAEEDFLYSLPRQLIIGLSTLFLSILTMLMAFSATITIMLRDNSTLYWVVVITFMLVILPMLPFVIFQMTLLYEVISSTYGPSIFKKVKMWP